MNSQPPSTIESESDLYQARIWLPVAWSAGPLLLIRMIPTTQRATESGPTRAQRRFSEAFTGRCSFRVARARAGTVRARRRRARTFERAERASEMDAPSPASARRPRTTPAMNRARRIRLLPSRRAAPPEPARDVDGLVAEHAAERAAEREPDPLHDGRRERELNRVEVGLRDHREVQRVRHPLAVRLAVGGEREHRLDQRLELQRGPDLADEVRDLVAGVPELVRRAGGHGEALAGAGDELLAADLEADGAAEDLEALLLARVDVRRGDEAVRLDVGLDHDGRAVRLTARLPEDETLAGDRVLDRVSCADHACLLLGGPRARLTLALSEGPLKIRLGWS